MLGILVLRGGVVGRHGRARAACLAGPGAYTKLDGATAEGSLDGGAPVRDLDGLVDDGVALVAEGGALGFAVGGGGGVIAVLAEREGGDGGGEVDALVRGRGGGAVVGYFAGRTEDIAVGDAEDSCGGCGASVAYCMHAY